MAAHDMSILLIDVSHLLENNLTEVQKYVCPRCDYILRDAVQMFCGHWACEYCAKELFRETSPRCPRKDCQELWSDDGEPPYFPDRFVRKTLGKVAVMCINAGCGWKGTIALLSQHFLECEYGKLRCRDCQAWISANEVKSHVEVCPGVLVVCAFSGLGCDHNEEMTRGQMVNHLTTPDNLAFHLEIIAKFMKSHMVDTHDVEKDGHEGMKPPAPALLRSAPTSYKEGLPKEYHCVVTDGPDEGAVGELYDTRGTLEQVYQERRAASMLQQFSSKEEFDALQKSLMQKDAMIATLQEKLQSVEKLVQTKSSEGEDRDFRLSLIENSNFDGTMIWKIPQFSQRTEDARTGKYTSIFSLPYYSGRYGYKMCLRLYILGDGIGKGTHMSLFFVVMKGEFDAILQWPFTHKVSFRLINQRHGRDIVDVFQPDPLSSSFQRPKTDMNVASGCPRFISLTELNQGGFIIDDTIFIKVKVDTSTIKHP